MTLISIFIGSILINNILLSDSLGLTSVLVILKEKHTRFIELMITLISILTTIALYFIYHYLVSLEYLLPVLSVIIIMIFVSVITFIVKKHFFAIKERYNDGWILLLFSPVTMGLGLLAIQKDYNLLETILFSLGSMIGLLLVLYVYANIKERLETSPIIRVLRGVPIALITLGIMAMIFSRYISI